MSNWQPDYKPGDLIVSSFNTSLSYNRVVWHPFVPAMIIRRHYGDTYMVLYNNQEVMLEASLFKLYVENDGETQF